MKYYLLRKVSDPKIKGVKTGLGQVELDEHNPITAQLIDFFLSTPYWKRGKPMPDFEISNVTASLYRGAKLTYFLDFCPSIMISLFMLSERLAEIFSKFNIQQYYTYPVALYENDTQLNDKYHIFFCPLLGYEVMNFSKSVFYSTRGLHDTNKKYIQYQSSEEFQQTYVPGFKVEKLVLNSNFDTSLDFFWTRLGGIHVSEALKDAIEILGFTGVRIFDDKEPLIITQN